MNAIRHVSFRVFATLFILLAANAAFADDDDPPSRVARLKYISGEVSIQPGGVDDWVAATINRPLTTSDKVWADRDARAELHLGTSVVRLDHETSMGFTNLTDETVQIALYQGALNLTIKHMYGGEIYEIDTPNVVFTVTKSGEYRFDVNSHTDTTYATVRKGELVATSDGPAVKVKKNKTAIFRGKGSDYHIANAGPRDGFDEWSKVRDNRESYVVARRYVSPYVIGYEDLDGYGDWRLSVGYGHLWFPRVAVGWAPYRYGHWVWVHPWGWTWVDNSPWGFAPAHYGRWVHYRGRWGWCPGPIRVRPYYAPALVAWVGGSNWNVGIGFGGGRNVGWFPLGYGEPYIPHRRVSRRYFQQVNVTNTRITNVTNITNIYNTTYNNSNNTNITRVTNIDNSVTNIDNSRDHIHNNNRDKDKGKDKDKDKDRDRDIRIHNNNIRYANLKVRDAVTGVPQDALVHGRPVDKVRVNLDKKDLDERQIGHGPQVAPSRQSVLGDAGERRAARPQGVAVKPVREKLAAPRQVSFDEQRQAMERQVGRPQDRENGRQERSTDVQKNAGDARSPGMANDRDHPAHRPGQVTERGKNGAPSAVDTPVNQGRPQRADAQPAEKNTDGRGNSATVSPEMRRDLPARVPRPPRRGRDDGQTSSVEASNVAPNNIAPNNEQQLSGPGRGNGNNGRDAREDRVTNAPRPAETQGNVQDRPASVPRPPQRGGMGNGGGNGRGSREDRVISSPRPAEPQRAVQETQVSPPKPPQRGPDVETARPRPEHNTGRVDRGSGMESRPAPVDRPEARPMPAPRNEPRVAPSPRVEAPRSEPRVERAPRSEPQSRPETSAPRQSEAPRANEARPQSNGGGGGQGRSGGSQERSRPDRGRDKKSD